MLNNEYRIENKNMKSLITAGKAIITLESGETGVRFTFKINGKKNAKGLYTFWFVQLLTGPNNDSHYDYLGYFKDDYQLSFSDKSCAKPDTLSAKAFNYFMKHLENIPEKLHVYHAGKCLRCGRTLTTPESIKKGFGPECINFI